MALLRSLFPKLFTKQAWHDPRDLGEYPIVPDKHGRTTFKDSDLTAIPDHHRPMFRRERGAE